MMSRRISAIAGLAGMALVLAGCGSASPGAAAIIGQDRISERDLTEQVQEVLRAQGRALDTASQALVATTLDRMITTSLVEQLAEREGIEVTQGELDTTLANFAEASGGQEAFEQSLLQQDLAPDDIPEIIRVNILAQKLGFALDPNGTPETQNASIFTAVTNFSQEIGTEVSPRYGSWDPVSLAVGAAPDDLSVPAGF